MKRMFIATLGVLFLSVGPVLAAGAIAVDDEAGDSAGSAGYGTAVGDASEVKRDALKYCAESGNKNCEVVVTFGDGKCGAYASSRNNYGTGTGSTKQSASATAMENCGAGCKLVVSECDD